MTTKTFFGLVPALLLSMTAAAQETDPALPHGLLMGMPTKDVPTVYAPGFDAEAVQAEDEFRAQAGLLPMYGRILPMHVDPRTHGLWTTLGNGDRIWRVELVSPGALALEVFFGEFRLPEGARLHVLDGSGEQVLGGYTSAHGRTFGVFSSEQVLGDRCLVEYYEPLDQEGKGGFLITGVAHAYRGAGEAKAQDCQVDIVCSPEGDGWQDEADGVVRIRVVEGTSVGFCSGSLVNNTASDCRPFVLTALHCGVSSTTANFQQWKFYFKYARTGCDNGTASLSKVLTGCTRRADSNDGGGNSGSDFLLVETDDVPASFDPYWNGWNAGTSPSASGVSIHHPSGDEKKISTYTSSLVSSSWGIANTHWRVIWAQTPNGHGVTEGGSSGAPIFDPNGRIVGTLTGGQSYCNSVVPGGQNFPDWYGKMDRHWNSNPNPANEKLKVWLDPGNTGVTVFDGARDPCGFTGISETSDRPAPMAYPNPASDQVVLDLPDGVVQADRIDLIDVSGRIVRSERPVGGGRITMDVSDLQSGTYLVRLTADGLTYGTTRVNVVH